MQEPDGKLMEVWLADWLASFLRHTYADRATTLNARRTDTDGAMMNKSRRRQIVWSYLFVFPALCSFPVLSLPGKMVANELAAFSYRRFQRSPNDKLTEAKLFVRLCVVSMSTSFAKQQQPTTTATTIAAFDA